MLNVWQRERCQDINSKRFVYYERTKIKEIIKKNVHTLQ